MLVCTYKQSDPVTVSIHSDSIALGTQYFTVLPC